MKNEKLIAIEHFCINHDIEVSFVTSLHQYGLIQTTTIEGELFVELDQLPALEKFSTFYYELEINLEGIETIVHLLKKIDELQSENRSLKNRLGSSK